ncbi:hypothetical protein VTJ04DRAFT_5904 [Mycothermus thermophilus]|uniref:uncharacterized protein n=1 Tax=Humicola insolens TaxID=85995 RepID=UPI0037445C5C
MFLRGVVVLGLLCHGVIGIPQQKLVSTSQAPVQQAAPRKLHGRFLHITDIHPDKFYKAHSATDGDGACHRGKGEAGRYGAAASECDSPIRLVNATFDWIAAHLRDKVDFVVWTGDSARHDRDERLPRSADQVFGANQWIADRLVEVFASNSSRRRRGGGPKTLDANGGGLVDLDVPIVPTFGNNDILPHNILLPGPNRMLTEYTAIWRHFIPEEQRHSFEFGGWFLVDVIPNHLAVVSLNTLYFFDRNAGVDGCADHTQPGYKQMEWLRVQLQFLRERGMKAILMGHVPPARTPSKALWDETCWQRYSLWVDRFRDVVVGGLFGHMNIDHFLIGDREDVKMDYLIGQPEEIGGLRRRLAMDDDDNDGVSIQGVDDYFLELRAQWAKLVPPPREPRKKGGNGEEPPAETENVKGGNKKKKKKGKKKRPKKKPDPKDPWGERYHLSLVSPSVVPTYFPSLRVYEYNITGLENAMVWADAMMLKKDKSAWEQTTTSSQQKHLDLRRDLLYPSPENEDVITNPDDLYDDEDPDSLTYDNSDPDPQPESDDDDDATTNKKKKKGRKGRKKKPIHDPDLVIPDPPPHSASPGPAYSPQPLTLMGYTQYFANLTKIHMQLEEKKKRKKGDGGDGGGDDGGEEQMVVFDDDDEVEDAGVRKRFFEVEYSTFKDKELGLKDLTVNSYLRLAVRMAKGLGRGKDAEDGEAVGELEEEEEGDDDDDEGTDEETDDESEEDDTDQDDDGDDDDDDHDEVTGMRKRRGRPRRGRGGRNKRKGKGNKNRKHNKTWLHFLKYAFVGVIDEDELKDEFD